MNSLERKTGHWLVFALPSNMNVMVLQVSLIRICALSPARRFRSGLKTLRVVVPGTLKVIRGTALLTLPFGKRRQDP